jgi:hypothetical protein
MSALVATDFNPAPPISSCGWPYESLAPSNSNSKARRHLQPGKKNNGQVGARLSPEIRAFFGGGLIFLLPKSFFLLPKKIIVYGSKMCLICRLVPCFS